MTLRYPSQLGMQFRASTRPPAAGATVAALLPPAVSGHPWTGSRFSAGWGSQEPLNVTLVQPGLVVEVGVDAALDSAGRWRHPHAGSAAAQTSPPAACPRSAADRPITRVRGAGGVRRLELLGAVAEVCHAPIDMVRCDQLWIGHFSEAGAARGGFSLRQLRQTPSAWPRRSYGSSTGARPARGAAPREIFRGRPYRGRC